MAGLLKIIVFFVVIYFILSVLRRAFRNIRSMPQDGMKRGGEKVRGSDGDKVIELDKDQYHVE